MSTPERDTISRLRDLHGVYERALMLAGDALVEVHQAARPGSAAAGLGTREWFDALIRRAAADLEDYGRLRGRWALFGDEEIAALYEVLVGGSDGPKGKEFLGASGQVELEINQEYKMRGLAQEGDEDT